MVVYFIAHRGNIYGPNPKEENKPIYVINAIDKGYSVEVDLWKLGDRLYLGHDYPKYEIAFDFLKSFQDELWIHVKNRLALEFVQQSSQFGNKNRTEFNYFWNNNDTYALTSKGYIWCHSKSIKLKNSIIVMPELSRKYEVYININEVGGICSDYIVQYKDKYFVDVFDYIKE